MRTIVKVAILTSAAVLMLVGDMAIQNMRLPFELQLVPEAEAIAGRQRRTRRRGVAVGYTAGAASASASQTSASSSTSQQQAATAQQQSETAQQQSETAQQQSATAQQQAAASQPAPTAMVASLPDGCVSAGNVFKCGNTYYQPYMQGNQVVYGVVAAPQ